MEDIAKDDKASGVKTRQASRHTILWATELLLIGLEVHTSILCSLHQASEDYSPEDQHDAKLDLPVMLAHSRDSSAPSCCLQHHAILTPRDRHDLLVEEPSPAGNVSFKYCCIVICQFVFGLACCDCT